MLYKPTAADTEKVRAWLARALDAGKPRGLSLTGLAEHCGVSRQAVNGWLKTGRITKTNLAKASAYLGSAPSFVGSGVIVADEVRASRATVWPFKHITPQRWRRLGDVQRARIEAYARGVLDEYEAAGRHAKSGNGTDG